MQIILEGKFLLDTNILVYAFDRSSPYYQKAKKLILKAVSGQFEINIAQQNLVEFCNVLSRNYHILPSTITKDVNNILHDFQIINPLPSTLSLFLKLFQQNKPNAHIFDLYLIATMLDNGINQIITLNEKDFDGISGIKIFNPFAE